MEECHALWTHIEATLETFWRDQVLGPLVLSHHIFAHALGFLSKRFSS
jgi:hypothetical protein